MFLGKLARYVSPEVRPAPAVFQFLLET